jgi:hypothetical protein
MKKVTLAVLLFLSGVAVLAASAAVNFSGHWIFDPTQGRNTGMMSQANIQTTVTQSKTQLVVDDDSTFKGQRDAQHTTYDLTGKLVNNASTMAGQSITRSHWEAARLITEWNSAGAIAGTTTTRIETRYLSADGKTMYVESARPGQDPMVLVFTKDK